MLRQLRLALACPLLLAACGGDEFTATSPGATGGAPSAGGTSSQAGAGSSAEGGTTAQAGGSGGAAAGGAAGGPSAGGASGKGGATGKGGGSSKGGGSQAGGSSGSSATGGSSSAGTGGSSAGTSASGGTGAIGGSSTAGPGGSSSEGPGGSSSAGASATGGTGAGGSTTTPSLAEACNTEGGVYDPAGHHCYVDITTTQGINAWNLPGAHDACTTANLSQMFAAFTPFASHLLELETAVEQAFVTKAAVGSADDDVWMDLSCTGGNCACGTTCGNHVWQWIDDSPPQYWNPDPDGLPWGPLGPSGTGKCAALTPAAAGTWSWDVRECDKYQHSGPTGTRYYRVICEIE